MKKSLLLLFILCGSKLLTAQSSLFLDTTNQWLMRLDYFNGMAERVTDASRWAVEDTLVTYNNHQYKVFNSYRYRPGTFESAENSYCLREDTSTGIIYIKPCDTFAEELIYMRNDLNIGDTLTYYGFLAEFESADTVMLITEAIGYDTFTNKITDLFDSVKYYDFSIYIPEDQDRFYSESPRFSFLHGFDAGPVLSSYYTFENEIWFTYCFYNQTYGNGNIQYLFTGNYWRSRGNTPCSEIFLSAPDRQLTPVLIYPNPADNIINVQGDFISANSYITIINSVGQTVLRKEYEPQIDVSGLTDGIFMLQITKEGSLLGYATFLKSRQ